MKRINFLLSTALLATLFFTACSDDDGDSTTTMEEPAGTIVELAETNGFTSLAIALEKTGLESALMADGSFTVFAPTNEAFDNLLDVIGQSSIEDVPESILEAILLYHVLDQSVLSGEVSAGNVTTLNGKDIELSLEDGIAVNSSSVVAPFDVEASNGVIHTINSVLVPEDILRFVNTVLEPAYFNKQYSDLISAAVKADLVSTLLETENLTIFAPSNDAFTKAGIDVESLDAETLTSVLQYHVIGSKVLSSEIPMSASSLNGTMFFSKTQDGVFINGNTKVVATDIESGTGVVHVLDNVLMPPSGNLVEVAVELTNDGEFTSLVAALQRTADEGTEEQNLLNVLGGEGKFTVFAPTNAAFQALLDSNSDWNALSDIPLETLVAVLTYHVVPAVAFDVDLASVIDTQNQIATANGSNLTFDLTNLTIDSNAKIVGTNTLATNGVIHVIDAVLLP